MVSPAGKEFLQKGEDDEACRWYVLLIWILHHKWLALVGSYQFDGMFRNSGKLSRNYQIIVPNPWNFMVSGFDCWSFLGHVGTAIWQWSPFCCRLALAQLLSAEGGLSGHEMLDDLGLLSEATCPQQVMTSVGLCTVMSGCVSPIAYINISAMSLSLTVSMPSRRCFPQIV